MSSSDEFHVVNWSAAVVTFRQPTFWGRARAIGWACQLRGRLQLRVRELLRSEPASFQWVRDMVKMCRVLFGAESKTSSWNGVHPMEHTSACKWAQFLAMKPSHLRTARLCHNGPEAVQRPPLSPGPIETCSTGTRLLEFSQCGYEQNTCWEQVCSHGPAKVWNRTGGSGKASMSVHAERIAMWRASRLRVMRLFSLQKILLRLAGPGVLRALFVA